MAAHKNNVCDALIAHLPEEDKADLARRYSSLSLDVPSLKFIDRMVADSRDVTLNHTAGLGTPQQIQMSLFALKCLTDKDNHYKTMMQALVKGRLEALRRILGEYHSEYISSGG